MMHFYKMQGKEIERIHRHRVFFFLFLSISLLLIWFSGIFGKKEKSMKSLKINLLKKSNWL